MKKIALFGAGDIARQLLDMLGADLVEFFFCNNCRETEINGKPVLSYDEFLVKRDDVNIIIASTRYAGEMAAQLKASGIYDYFTWDENVHKLLSMQRLMEFPRYSPVYCGKAWESIPFSIVKSFYSFDLSVYENIILYTYPETSQILMQLIGSVGKKKNVNCVIHPGEAADRTFALLKDKTDCVICAVRREDNEICDEYEHIKEIGVIDLYDIAKFVPEFHSAKAKKYENRHRGKRCFVIGNGPSLRIEDLQKLHDNNEITFACNKIYNAFEDTEWRPDYYFITDVWVLKGDTKRILNVQPKICSFYNYAFCNGTVLWNGEDNVIPLYNMPEQPDTERMTRFSRDVSVYHSNGGGSVYTMLQTAYYMGFDKVYLLGCDHYISSLEETKKADHFYDSNADIIWELIPDYTKINNHLKLTKSFEAAKLAFEEDGRCIYNATRGGYLEVYERVNFDSLFV